MIIERTRTNVRAVGGEHAGDADGKHRFEGYSGTHGSPVPGPCGRAGAVIRWCGYPLLCYRLRFPCGTPADTLADIASLLAAVNDGTAIPAAPPSVTGETSSNTGSPARSARGGSTRRSRSAEPIGSSTAIVTVPGPQAAVADRLLQSKLAVKSKVDEMRKEKEAKEVL